MLRRKLVKTAIHKHHRGHLVDDLSSYTPIKPALNKYRMSNVQKTEDQSNSSSSDGLAGPPPSTPTPSPPSTPPPPPSPSTPQPSTPPNSSGDGINGSKGDDDESCVDKKAGEGSPASDEIRVTDLDDIFHNPVDTGSD